MFEIGASLRDARQRRGLDFPEVERGTKIRAKYLRALEDETFLILPSETYVKGFLRTYAEYLGLDGQPFVDEYLSRYLPADELDQIIRRPRRTEARRPSRRVQTTVAVAGLVAIVLVTALVIVAWRYGDGRKPVTPVAPVAPAVARLGPTSARIAHLAVTANGGGTWLSVHVGSSAGRILFEGTLASGETRSFSGGAIWATAGNPAHLVLRANGHRVRLDLHRTPTVLLVTPSGVATG